MSIKDVIAWHDAQRIEAADPSKFKHLVSAVKSWMGAWPAQSTYTDRLRASQLFFTCPREFVLNYWQPTANRDFDMRSYLFMSTGTHLHQYAQDYILGPMGILSGTWVNNWTGDDVKGFHPNPEEALMEISHQQKLTWTYIEDRFFDETYRVGGHIDGQVDLSRIEWLHENPHLTKKDPVKAMTELQSLPLCDDNLINLEIKTCGNYVFENLIDSDTIPEYYKMQAEIYQHMTGKDKTVFWYINRDTMNSKLILYENTTKWWRDAKRKAKIIWKSIRDETLPISGMVCFTPRDKRAKECAFRGPCFEEMDFADYVRAGKERAAREGRRLLDLSKVTFD